MSKKYYLGIAFVLVAVIFFFIGASNKTSTSDQEQDISTDNNLESVVKNYPRGELDIPAQWFMMEGLVGWEKMMFIFGYADNRDVCYHLADIAKEESPDRNFRCEDAN